MIITEKASNTLEYYKICEMLADCANTQGAKEMALSLRPTENIQTVIRRQHRTTDAKLLMDVKGTPTFGMVRDVGEACERAAKGATLSPKELLDIAGVLRTARLLLDYIQFDKKFDTVLDDIFNRLIPDRKLETAISRAILSEDSIADEASRELSEIRRKKREANNRIKETLQKYTTGVPARYLRDNIVTTRNGRFVIPVKAEYKSEVQGLIHDTSSSGATFFIEPMSVVDANNELRTLESREAHEIERILAEFSLEVSTKASAIDLNYKNITELAFCFACATLSTRMRGISPMISSDRSFFLRRARHPLIEREKVVPITVSAGGDYDTLIITGPNTGGKTVTLKTVGLFALMVQAGLHIPAADGSSICLFDNILVDIGDDQSIEQSLSTFSSHMVNIVEMLKEVGNRSLVLFDELCTGTDPVEGAALAISVIEAVRESGALCVATTHYAELKAYALDTQGVCNASCEFDINTLRPTYRLIIGTPGKSNAFAISQKLGLPDGIVNRAKTYVNADSRRFEKVVEQLEHSRIEMERNRTEAERMKAEFESFKIEAEKKLEDRLSASEHAVEDAQKKAKAIVDSARISAEYIMKQMEKLRQEQNAADLSERMAQARREMREYIRAGEEKYNPVEERVDEDYVLPRPLVQGDRVWMMNIAKEGEVIQPADRNGMVEVRSGILRTKTKLQNLKLLIGTKEEKNKEEKKTAKGREREKTSTVTISSDRTTFRPEIDLRGMTGDEAWLKVDKYLDDAMLAGIRTVSLIHGKGTGMLKKALWNDLRTDGRIASYRIGQYGEGDGGVTVVELK